MHPLDTLVQLQVHILLIWSVCNYSVHIIVYNFGVRLEIYDTFQNDFL